MSPPVPTIDHQHADVSGGWLRAAVFGGSDGLVSNFALIAGVAGGGVSPSTIALTGMAGLAAGAFSMATGEWISVRTQNEMTHREVEKERAELHRNPHEEAKELAGYFVGHGVEPELALEVARQIADDPEAAVRVHAQTELGLDPSALPSPWVAAIVSFLAFALGAVIPVVPYLVGAVALAPAIVAAGLGLFIAGALASRVTARTWWFTGTRQLVLGMVAAGVTYAVGGLVGAAV
jgi:VIT1/CCC1 family predicted Fe2+/Mn2+ transporter